MRSSSSKTREFPALLMTALFVGASLGTTGAIRVMTDQTRPSAIRVVEKNQDFTAPSPKSKLIRVTVATQPLSTNH